MSRETVLTNARIVLRDRVLDGTLVLRDGLIAEIAPGAAARGEDVDGDLVMPGLVELHTDHLEAHFTPRPGTDWDPVPAVLAHDVQLSGAGVTTVFDAIRIGYPCERVAAAPQAMIDAVTHASQAGLTRAEHLIHLRCEVSEPTAAEQFADFASAAAVRLASLMDHTPGQRQYVDLEAYRRYMVGKGRIAESELEATMQRLRETAAVHSLPNRRAVAELAADRGLTLAAHDDATVEHVRESAALGVRISEFPTTAVAAQAAGEHDQLVVMGAPNVVRGGSQSGNVAATALLTLGALDILSSDYVPASPLQAVFQLASGGTLSLPEGSRLLSANPARAVGLDDRGEIAVGLRADLVRVRPHELPATAGRPAGQQVPVVRSLYRQGTRVL